MPIDERLRIGLTANAKALPEPNVELLLDNALSAHRRHVVRRWAGVAGMAAAACAAVALPALWQGNETLRPPVGGTSFEGGYAGLVTTVPGAPQASGRWALELDADGQLVATAPNSYGESAPQVIGAVDGRNLQSRIFDETVCQGRGPGSYTTSRRGDRVVFQVVRDPCSTRVLFFTTTTWISTDVSAYTGPKIPEGRWARDITASQLNALGFHPDAAWLASNGFTDGKSRFVIEFAGSRWFIFIETDQGGLEIGDQGTTAYDALGRWVQNGAMAIEWSIKDETLTTRNVVPVEGLRPAPTPTEERVILEGTWQRVS